MTDNSFLDRIANYLMINYPFVQDISLMKGRMGGVVFFCEYAKYTGKDYYFDYAFDLFESIYNSIPSDIPLNFCDGLCGIGWGIEYLLQNEFMDGNSDDVLQDFDTKIMEWDTRKVTDFSLDTGLSGILLYVLTRLESFDRKEKVQPFDRLYLSELFNKIESNLSAIPLILRYKLSNVKTSKTDFNCKPCVSDIMFGKLNINSHDDFNTIPIGIKNGLTQIAFNLIAI